MHQNKNKNHIPVLLDAVLNYLDPKFGDSYLDLTAGYGGHAKAILGRTNAPDKCVLVDRDETATGYLKKQFGKEVNVIHKDFLTASQQLASDGRKFENILADLGLSSLHLNTANRGFSFRMDGPLDMRMDQSSELSANTVINRYSEAELAKIIREYGEEPKARNIAQMIVRSRPINSTAELAETVLRALSSKSGRNKIHPATKTFQAIRIEVNDELNQLKQALPYWIELLEAGGRLVVISFHSLEDRIVKQYLNSLGKELYDAEIEVLTKRPVTSDANEIAINPRARSAKLRAVAKIKTRFSEKAESGERG